MRDTESTGVIFGNGGVTWHSFVGASCKDIGALVAFSVFEFPFAFHEDAMMITVGLVVSKGEIDGRGMTGASIFGRVATGADTRGSVFEDVDAMNDFGVDSHWR